MGLKDSFAEAPKPTLIDIGGDPGAPGQVIIPPLNISVLKQEIIL